MSAGKVAALYVRADSVYKSMGVDCWDAERDARSYFGPMPVVAHPPCRAWGRLRAFAKPRPDEKDLAFHAVHAVRRWGGVLEHPLGSTLWSAAGLPLPGYRDSFGGFTHVLDQLWFGHKARKATWVYVCGVNPSELPAYPLLFAHPTHCIGSPKEYRRLYGLKSLHQAAREATPVEFARWLIDVAARCAK